MVSQLLSSDAIPFADQSAAAILAIFAIYVMAFFVRGAIGFGSAMPAVVLTSWILPPHEAIILAMMSGAVSQGQFLRSGFRGVDWAVTRMVLLTLVVGSTLGVLCFTSLDPRWLTLTLGIVISAVVLVGRPQAVARLMTKNRKRSGAVAGAVSGFIGSLAGAGGMYILVVYLRQACRDRHSLRATNIVVSTVFLVWRSVAVALTGLITTDLVLETVVLMPAIFAGGWLGTSWFSKTDAQAFTRLLNVIILLFSGGLIIKSLVDMTSS